MAAPLNFSFGNPQKLGIDVTFVQPDDPSHFEAAIQANTKAIFFESLGNPNINIIDFQAVAEIAKRHRVISIVDSTLPWPYLVRTV